MILFLDIDGPLIPSRAYAMPTQTKPIVTTFDPCAVGMLNRLVKERDSKFVVHSSWLRSNLGLGQCNKNPQTVKEHMLNEGLVDAFHEDWACQWKFSGTRWLAIDTWLESHPKEASEPFFILEDEPAPRDYQYQDNLIAIHFDNGFTYAQFQRILFS